MADSNVTPNFLVQITNVTTNALAKNCQSGGDTTPGQELMRRLHRDAGGAGTGARGAKRGQGQALLTGTDAEAFSALHGVAEGLRTGEGGLAPDPAFPAAPASLGSRSGGGE